MPRAKGFLSLAVISLKLNSFFLMPFCETLPTHMRRALTKLERDIELALPDDQAHSSLQHADRLRAQVAELEADGLALQKIAAAMGRARAPGAVLRGGMPKLAKLPSALPATRR